MYICIHIYVCAYIHTCREMWRNLFFVGCLVVWHHLFFLSLIDLFVLLFGRVGPARPRFCTANILKSVHGAGSGHRGNRHGHNLSWCWYHMSVHVQALYIEVALQKPARVCVCVCVYVAYQSHINRISHINRKWYHVTRRASYMVMPISFASGTDKESVHTI